MALPSTFVTTSRDILYSTDDHTSSSFVITRYNTSNAGGPANIFLGSDNSLDNRPTNSSHVESGASFANCTIEPKFVESEVHCEGLECQVKRMRESTPYDAASWYWNETPIANSGYWDNLVLGLPIAITAGFEAASTPTEYYLSGAESYPFMQGKDSGVALHTVPIRDLERRFGTIFNTYWLSSLTGPWSLGDLGRWETLNKKVPSSCRKKMSCFVTGHIAFILRQLLLQLPKGSRSMFAIFGGLSC